MSMVAVEQQMASAFVVVGGHYGDVSRYAHEHGVCRQWGYRQAGQVQQHLEVTPPQCQRLRQEVQELRQRQAELEQRRTRAVVLDKEKQAEFASVAQAQGVSLPVCWNWFDVLLPGQQQSGATLGRATQAAGQKAGPWLTVLDEVAQVRPREAAADEIYVTAAVLRVVEQQSLCWLTGRLRAAVNGEAWARELRQFPNLAQTAREGGNALAKGVALVNAERQAQGQPPVVGPGDHVHALRGGRLGLLKDEKQARTAQATAETAQRALQECQRQGTSQRLATIHALAAWRKAEQALDTWSARTARATDQGGAAAVHAPRGLEHTPAGGSGPG